MHPKELMPNIDPQTTAVIPIDRGVREDLKDFQKRMKLRRISDAIAVLLAHAAPDLRPLTEKK
jgi:hypothetical protein